MSRFDSEVGYQINIIMRKLLEDFIKDIRIESVKFRLQTSVPHGEHQRNDIIGTFEYSEQDGATVAETLGKQLRKIEDLLTAHDPIPQLAIMVKEWNDARITIQYQGYYGNESRSEAYCYVLLLRILKRKHKNLYQRVRKRLTTGKH